MNTYTVPFELFAEELSFRLLEKPIHCAACGGSCLCESYDGRALVYRCTLCHAENLDPLDIAPLFAADPLDAILVQHYQIACPYCGGTAPIVGGNPRKGLYFVCLDRCHHAFTRTIRRY